ncbi:MAG: cyclic nucleotide-binding domain-containing protein [Gammaproteobacteria bacterium]|nr:cyclic nucleotide-binding domain-containing protein [Gammaproteobacteria bacterium]
MKKDLVTFLMFTPFFGGISKGTVERIISLSKHGIIHKGELFFNEHDQANSMFVLLSGAVEVYKTWNNRQYPVTYLHQGDCFGEMSVIDHCQRSASVLALEDCEILEIGMESFAAIYEEDIKQYTMLQMNIGREVSRRLREANELLFQLKVEQEQKEKSAKVSVEVSEGQKREGQKREGQETESGGRESRESV